MTASERIPCSVPGCRRTAPRARFPDAGAIICGRCFRSATKPTRDAHKALLRMELRQQDLPACLGDSPIDAGVDVAALLAQCPCGAHVWDRLMREAAEARAGLA